MMRDSWLSTNLVYQPMDILNQLNSVRYVDTAYKPIVEVEYKLFRKSKYMKII